MTTIGIEVVVQRPVDTDAPADDHIAAWVRAACETAGEGRGEVVVRIVDDVEMQTLNRDYRGQDKTTNVLSFPADWPVADAELPLGDIIISADVVRREAAEQGKHSADHWAHLIVHGSLHLLGYDHIDPDDAERMEALEVAVLQQFDIKNPY